MLLQTLVTTSIMVLLAGALFTSALVSAKANLHDAATRQAALALTRGTNDFRLWAAKYVSQNRAGAQWPANVRISDPEAACGTCSMRVALAYQIVGSTTAGTRGTPAVPGIDAAQNLQTLLNEQRVAVEVTASVSSPSGAVLGTATREVTLRVFDAAPWAVVTGVRDVTTVLGSVHAAEGDSGGADPANNAGASTPNPAAPAAYKNTTIEVTMTCVNSAANSAQSSPFLDNQPPGNNSMPWGVQAHHRAFEAPCTPTYGLSQVPSDADVPRDGNYRVGAFSPQESWSNGSRTDASAWTQ